MCSLREDDLFKTSTQYRLWSFSPEALASSRKSTNYTAAVRVVAAIKNAKTGIVLSSTTGRESENVIDHDARDNEEANVETLTPAEEQILLTHYTRLMIQNVAQDTFALPPQVTATAAQYLKRFYIQNSIMTYHPKSIFPTCLYLAMKNCHHHMSLPRFINKLGTGQSTEDVLAPEFLLCQGLRFSFDVRWPGRGLRGGLMELLEMAAGNKAFGGRKAQKGIFALESVETGLSEKQRMQRSQKIKEMGEKYEAYLLEKRCMAAYETATMILGEAALLTDVYLLYTPSHIWLAALWLADTPLTEHYISRKFSPSSKASNTTLGELFAKLIATIKSCASLLSSYDTSNVEKKELVRIDKKLYGCLNPEKQDLIKLRRNQKKRNGEEGLLDEKTAKKRRLEREQADRDGNVFGPELDVTNTSITG